MGSEQSSSEACDAMTPTSNHSTSASTGLASDEAELLSLRERINEVARERDAARKEALAFEQQLAEARALNSLQAEELLQLRLPTQSLMYNGLGSTEARPQLFRTSGDAFGIPPPPGLQTMPISISEQLRQEDLAVHSFDWFRPAAPAYPAPDGRIFFSGFSSR